MSSRSLKTIVDYPGGPNGGMKHRTTGHTHTSISSETRADWSDAFAQVPSLAVACVWQASVHTREVPDGLLRIGFLYPQQIIWNKGRTVLTRTHLLVSTRTSVVRQEKEGPLVRRGGRQLHDLRLSKSEIHYGRIEGGGMRADFEPHQRGEAVHSLDRAPVTE